MAKADYTGVPDEQPQGSAPDDYQHVQADPNAFGAGVAQGTGEVGAASTDAAFKLQDFYNQGAANDATNKFLKSHADILHGVPGQKVLGPDGTLVPDTGYLGLRGRDAMEAYPQVMAKLEETREAGREGLTPEALREYNAETRRYLAQSQGEIGAHADQQQRTWLMDGNNTSATRGLNAIAANPNNVTPDMIDAVRKPLVRNAQLAGENAGGAILKADQAIATMQIQALLPTDPTGAMAILTDKKGLLASMPGYDGLVDRVQARARDVTAHAVADQALIPGGASLGIAPHAEAIAPLLQKAIPGLVITGMGRTPATNTAVGGVSDSAHLLDHALDIRPTPGLTADVLQKQMAAVGLPDAKVIYEGPNAAHSTAPHFHVQWGSGGTQQPQSTADYYRQNFKPITDKARADYLAKYPQDVDGGDRAASLADTQMRAAITQDEMRVKSDYHALDAAAAKPGANGQLPITIDQLLQSDPSLRAGWENLQLQNPYAASNFENHLLKANAMPANTTYGNQFYDLYGKIITGQIKDSTGLLPFIDATKGNNSPLTKEGYGELKGMLGAMATPNGSALAHTESDFFKRLRPNITLTNPAMNMADDAGDKKFNQFMIAALGRVRAEIAAGTPPAKIFDPKGDIATMAQSFMMSPAEAASRQIQAMRLPANYGSQGGAAALDLSTPDGVRAAVSSGRLDRAKGESIAVQHGWIRPPAAAVPTPH